MTIRRRTRSWALGLLGVLALATGLSAQEAGRAVSRAAGCWPEY